MQIIDADEVRQIVTLQKNPLMLLSPTVLRSE
jgi:hypothetical protein